MKVLHIIIGLDVGGAELMLKRLIESHRFNNIFQHTVISLTNIGKVGEQMRSSGVEVLELGMRSFLDVPRVLWQLRQLIRKLRPGIVQTWMYHADLIGGLAARSAGNRNIIWGIRTTEVSSGCSRITRGVRYLCALLSYWIPDTIICAADASKNAHVNLGYNAARMTVVPNGFDMDWLVSSVAGRGEFRLQLGYEEDDLVVGSLGRFNADKDQENFVKAAGVLARKYPQMHFLMVGRDVDSDNAMLAGWIAETGYTERFVLLGERGDVPTCLSAMDIFCLHSCTEGFPNVLGEAMAIGLACVTTDVGDARLMLGDAGVVVPKKDAVALARGVEALLVLSEYERILMGQKARKRINDEFTMSHTRERFETIYNKILTGNVS
jgi:glycosyltransferase involved in cell wall biosynthesis